MPWVGFEHITLVFERAKTVHALDRAATVIAKIILYTKVIVVWWIIELKIIRYINKLHTTTDYLWQPIPQLVLNVALGASE
jgi:hypothetical protein